MGNGSIFSEGRLIGILYFQNGNVADASSEEEEILMETVENDPELARINQDKALLSLGLYRYRIPADGNCLFRSVASQLKLDQERYHPVLRKAAVKWMQANAEELIVGGMLDCLGEIEAAGELGTWAGQAAIVALANIFSINIAVVQGGDKGDIDIQHISPFESSVDGEEQGSVILAYVYNGHFDAVVDQEDLPNPDYEAWQYDQVHGKKRGDEASGIPELDASQEEVFIPSVENAERENIKLSCLADIDPDMTADLCKVESEAMDQSDIADSDPQTVIEYVEEGEKNAPASSFIADENTTETNRHQEEINDAAKPSKQLSEEEGKTFDETSDQLTADDLGDEDDTNRWASFFQNVHQELENEDTRVPPPPLNMRLDDIPEETQSQLATPMSTPLATPHEMENPWVNFTQTIETDSSFSDQNSSGTLTDDDGSEGSSKSVVDLDLENNKENESDKSESTVSDNLTFIDKTIDKQPLENPTSDTREKLITEAKLISHDNSGNTNEIIIDGSIEQNPEESLVSSDNNMEIGVNNVYDENSLGSDISLPSQTSSMSIALASDDAGGVSSDPRPTLNMQLSQDSLAGISPWSSFSQSVDKEAVLENNVPDLNSSSQADSLASQKIPVKNDLNIVALGQSANFSVSNVPDKSVANVAPVPQQFKTIRNLPKQWEDVKKDRASVERDGGGQKPEFEKEKVSESVLESKSGGVKDEIGGKKTTSNEREKEGKTVCEEEENAEKTFVSSTKWENNAEQCSNEPQRISSINISDILATENCIKCEHVVKPRIRVIPVQFCGKKGATLKSARSPNASMGLSISTGGGEVKIPIQSNKQRIKAEIIEERGSVDINGQQTETVERKGTYTTLPDDEPSEPKIDLIEHKPPVLTPLTGSKITITDNPNIPSPAPIIRPKKRVPVRVVHDNEPVMSATSGGTHTSQSHFDESPRVRNIPVVVTNEEKRPSSRSYSQDSPSTPGSCLFPASPLSENARSRFLLDRGASSESTAEKRKVSNSSTSTGYQSQTSASSSFDNGPDFPEVFGRQKSTEAAKVWDETAKGIEGEAERVKQRIEAARSALGGHKQHQSSSMADRTPNVSHSGGESHRFTDDNQRGFNTHGSTRQAYVNDNATWDSQRVEPPRGFYRGDSSDSSYSTRSTHSRSNLRGSHRSDSSWGNQSSTEDGQNFYRQRQRPTIYGEESSYSSPSAHSNIRIGAEASRYRNHEDADRRRNEQLGGSIQIEVVHENSDPFRDRLRRMTADDKPPSYFDLREDPVTVRNLLRPLNLSFVNSLLNAEIDTFFGRDDFFSDF